MKTELTSELRRAIRAVALAASTDDARAVLVGVHFITKGTDLVLTATDSYRLHRAKVKGHQLETDERYEYIVPARWLIEALKWAPERSVINAVLAIDDTYASVTYSGGKWAERVIAGQYPNADAIFQQWEGDEGEAIDQAGRHEMLNLSMLYDLARAASYIDDNGQAGATVRMRSGDQGFMPIRVQKPAHGLEFEAVLMPIRGL